MAGPADATSRAVGFGPRSRPWQVECLEEVGGLDLAEGRDQSGTVKALWRCTISWIRSTVFHHESRSDCISIRIAGEFNSLHGEKAKPMEHALKW